MPRRAALLKPGGTVVEGTAGNTGIGLAHVCHARGYKLILLMPDNQSPEKYQLLEALGAEVRKVPVVPYSNPAQYQHQAGRLAQELPNAVWANQFDNTANRRAHVESTGPEIWQQTAGRIDAFVSFQWHRRHAGRHFGVPEIKARIGAHGAGGSAGQRPVRIRAQW